MSDQPTIFHELFESHDKLKGLTPAQRVEVSNVIIGELGKTSQVPQGEMRGLREDRVKMLYEADKSAGKASGDFQTWQDLHKRREELEVIPEIAGQLPEKAQSDLVSSLQRENTWEYIKDVGRLTKEDPLYPLKSLANSTWNFAGIVGSTAAGLVNAAATFDPTKNKSGQRFMEGFQGHQETWQSLTPSQKLQEWVQPTVEKDPEAAEVTDWAVASLGFNLPRAVLGASRYLGASAKTFAGSLQTPLQKAVSVAPVAASPLVSSGIADYIAYNAVKKVETALENSDLEDGTKIGLSTIAMLGLVPLIGLTVGSAAEAAISGGRLKALAKIYNQESLDILSGPQPYSGVRDQPVRVMADRPFELAAPGQAEPPMGNPYYFDTTKEALSKIEAQEKIAQILKPVEKPGEVKSFGSITPQFVQDIVNNPEIRADLRQIAAETAAQEGRPAPVETPQVEAAIQESAQRLGRAIEGKNKILSGVEPSPEERVALNTQVVHNESGTTAPAFMPEEVQAIVPEAAKAVDTRTYKEKRTEIIQAMRASKDARQKKELENQLKALKKGEEAETQELWSLSEGEDRAQVEQYAKENKLKIKGLIEPVAKEMPTKTFVDRTISTLSEAEPEVRAALEVEVAKKVMKEKEVTIESVPEEKLPIIGTDERTKVEVPTQEALPKPRREDILSEINKLSDTSQMKIAQIADVVNSGRQRELGRPLTEGEKLDTLTKIWENKSLWNGSTYEPSNAVLMKDGSISAGFVEGRYPGLSNALSLLNPNARATQSFSMDSLFGIIQGGVNKLGRGATDGDFALAMPGLTQAFRLVDDIKEMLPKVQGENLYSFLREVQTQLGLTNKGEIALDKAFREIFPGFEVGFRVGETRGRVIATADALTRIVTVGADVKSLREVLHEVGHLFFYYGLDADQKVAWLQSMRKLAGSDESWAQAFPDWENRMAHLQKAKEEAIARRDSLTPEQKLAAARNMAKEEQWLDSPLEMFAQQFSAYMFDNRLPTAEALNNFTYLKNKIKQFMGYPENNWAKLPPDTQAFFIKLNMMPDESDIVALPKEVVQEQLGKSYLLASSPSEAQMRVAELDAYFNSAYGMRGREESLSPYAKEEANERFVDASVGRAQEMGIPILEERPWLDLPPEERIPTMAFGDLAKALERQGLMIQAGDPRYSPKEVQMLSRRLHELKEPLRRANLLYSETLKRYKVDRDTTLVQNDRTGLSIDPSTGSATTALDRQVAKEDAFISELNKANPEEREAFLWSQEQVEALADSKLSREFSMRLNKAGIKVKPEEFQELLRAAKSQLMGGVGEASTFNLSGADRIVRETVQSMQDIGPYQKGAWSNACREARNILKSWDVEAREAENFVTLALADKGLVDVLDGRVLQKLYQADEFMRVIGSGKNSLKELGFAAYSNGIRGAFAFYLGLEPDGEGGITWNPERYLYAPFVLGILPGRNLMLRGIKLGATSLFSKLPKDFQDSYNRLYDGVRKSLVRNFYEGGTDREDLKDIRSAARNRARGTANSVRAFAEVFQNNFTQRELNAIGQLLDRRQAKDQLRNFSTEQKRNIFLGADIVQNVLEQIGKELEGVGVFPDKLQLSKYFQNPQKAKFPGLLSLDNIAPIKLQALKGNELQVNVRRGVEYTNLEAAAQDLGGLQIGLKVNEYKTAQGSTYAPVGSRYDLYCKQNFQPYRTWRKGQDGLTVVDVSQKSGVRMTRPYTKEEAALKGEISSVAVRLAYMADKLEADYMKGYMFRDVFNSDLCISPGKRVNKVGGQKMYNWKDIKDFMSTPAGQDWVYIPNEVDKYTGAEKYGFLSGSYVHKDAFEILKATTSPTLKQWIDFKGEGYGKAWGLYQKAMSAWKVNKTVLNPGSHMNNFVSNIVMGTLMGHNVAKEFLEGYKYYKMSNLIAKAHQLNKRGDKAGYQKIIDQVTSHPDYAMWDSMKRSGLGDSSMLVNELNLDDMVQEIVRKGVGANQTVVGKAAEMTGGLYKQMVKWPSRLYEGGDLIFKMGCYALAKKEGLTDTQALRRAYEAYFDYSNLSRAATLARDTGVIPFVSYLSKSIPAMYKVMKEHPERVALLGMLLEVPHMMGVASAYGTDDLLEKSMATERSTSEFLKDRGFGGLWRTRGLLPWQTQMDAGKTSAGRLTWTDYTRMLGGADWLEGKSYQWGLELEEQQTFANPLMPFLKGVFTSNPLAQLGVMALSEKDLSLGKTLGGEGSKMSDTYVESRMRADFAKKVWNTFMPNLNFLYGTYAYDQTVNALVGEGLLPYGTGGFSGTDSLGVPMSLGSALANQFGLKNYEIDPGYTFVKEQKHSQFELNKEKGLANASNPAKNLRNTPEKFKEKMMEYLNLEQREKKRLSRGAQAIKTLLESGATRREQGGRTLPH